MNDRPNRNIYLIGMMGSGKSAVARAYAAAYGLAAGDLDDWIVEQAGKPIAEIFETSGEPAFRQMETAALDRSFEKSGYVFATGGGIIEKPGNRRMLKEKGRVVYLRASLPVLLERLRGCTERPLLKTSDWEKTVRDLMNRRAPLYEQISHYSISTDGKKAGESARLIYEKIADLL